MTKNIIQGVNSKVYTVYQTNPAEYLLFISDMKE